MKPSDRHKSTKSSVRSRCVLISAAIGLASNVSSLCAQVIEEELDQGREHATGSFILPYVFKTEAMDTGFGLSYSSGLFKGGGNIFVGTYLTANESYGVNFGAFNYQLGTSRWHADAALNFEDNSEQRFYGDLASFIGDSQGGSHNSPADDFLVGPGVTFYIDTSFRYILPIGDGRRNVVAHYSTNSGMLTGPSSGANAWNPLTSGRTEITARPFYQKRTLELDASNIDQFTPVLGLTVGDTAEQYTNGLDLLLTYDNRDFIPNPERGSFQRLTISRDFGWFDSTDSWTNLEADYRKYVSLGASDAYLQKILAFQFWTAYSPTFERVIIDDTIVFRHSAPSNMGATLGGSQRLRSYPVGRFSDKAAIYYSGEFRITPAAMPFKDWPLLRNMPIRWWQWVALVEAGRVAPQWNIGTLHDDMNWNYGVSLRSMIGSQVMRLELVTGDEATQLWFLVGQSF